MLAFCKVLLEDQNWHMEVPSKYAKLVTCLRTAAEKGDGTLDKEATSHDDLFDAIRLSLMLWH
jgi:hypothetical protein